MRIAKIFHRNEFRIKVDFPYNKVIESELRKIEGTRWSKTLVAWHIPYTKKAYSQLKQLFPDMETEAPRIKNIAKPAEKNEGALRQDSAKITVEINGRKIIIRMPWNAADVKFLRSIKYSKWDVTGFWQIPNYPGNAEMIKNYFGARMGSFTESESISISVAETDTVILGKNEVLVNKTQSGRLKLLFGYHLFLQKLLKQIPYNVWDSRNKWWTIPYSEDFLTQIKECI